MHPIIEEHRAAIEAACREFGVRRLEVFGSAARGDDFDLKKKSDVDFIAEFVRPVSMGAFRQFFGFILALEDIFDRKVDVIELAGITNPYLLEAIQNDRQLVYDSTVEKLSA